MKKAAVLFISFILLLAFAVSAFAEGEAIVKNEKLIPSESTEKSGFSDADFKELYTKAYYIGSAGLCKQKKCVRILKKQEESGKVYLLSKNITGR